MLRVQGSRKLRQQSGQLLAEYTEGRQGLHKPGLSSGTLPRKSTAGLQLPGLPEQEGGAASDMKSHPIWLLKRTTPSLKAASAGTQGGWKAGQREPPPGTPYQQRATSYY